MEEPMPMLMPMRIRLEFEDRRILSKSQRKDHLRRSWLLVRPENFATVADVAAHISDVFSLRRTCPFGLLLYMGEFVLPPFESTSIFRDSDIIRVKKKAIKNRKIQIQEDAIQDTNNVARFDQLHANIDSPLHVADATDKHEKAPLQTSGKERMVEGRDEDAFKNNPTDAAPINNWDVEVAKAKSEASATHFIEIASDFSRDQMNDQTEKSLLPQEYWDCWISNKNPPASWAWGVRGRSPSRNHGGKSGCYTSGKYLDSNKYSKSK
ncbi:coilin-like isoform X1 [Zingiber officinale]|uniref:coilin-like isoform X1 n=1 Tax=Zingiber officinale TaxID=94328 RepID=UPI001C4C8B84|nr:coilin-like isoform X1 [Zingiber officinale]